MGNFWSQPLRVECREFAQLCTSRTIASQLWFIYNKALEQRILAYLAKYQEKYSVIIYAFCILGNHYHLLAKFPFGGRSLFFRDLNARIAEAVRDFVAEHPGGPLFERRFTPQVLPLEQDIEKYFQYCALQAVSSGLTQTISEYAAYNSFADAASQIQREYTLFNYGAYNAARRTNPSVPRVDFIEKHTLSYSRLPQYEELSLAEYKKLMHQRVESKRQELVKNRLAEGKGFLGVEALSRVVPGSRPHSTKKGGLRPLVLSQCAEAKQQYLNWYFSIVEAYRRAVERYRRGEFGVCFPEGTFRPPGVCIP